MKKHFALILVIAVLSAAFALGIAGFCDYDMKEDVSINMFKSYPNKELFLFGASGFSDELINVNDENLKLIDLKTMFS